jgi:hypothetical protein
MDEFFEALSWAQLGLEQKPNGLLNVDGYYDELVAFLDRATASGFMKPKHRALLHVSADPQELLDVLGKQVPFTGFPAGNSVNGTCFPRRRRRSPSGD